MDMIFRPKEHSHAEHLAILFIVLAMSVAGFPTLLVAQARGETGVIAQVGKAVTPKEGSSTTIGGDRTSVSPTKHRAGRKEFPVRIPAGNAELRRLKSQAGIEDQPQPVIPPAR